MIALRPVHESDLDALERLAVMAGPGMTNLPAERDLLAEKIRVSLASFARAAVADTERDETAYLLVAVDTASDAVVGCTGIIGAVGMARPFYSYKLINLPHTSQELDRYETYSALQMVSEYRGAAEIGTLYLEPDARQEGNGRLLSRCRFLFMAEFRDRMADLVMAELRGVQDARGHSVFWESLGRHFFDMDFSKADYLSALGSYQFIADLMPKHPIYVRLLPPQAQAVIGVAHEHSRPALELLRREGFRFEGCVDVFDAGPTVHCPIDDLRTVRESAVAVIEEILDQVSGPARMVARRDLGGYRVARGPAVVAARGGVTLARSLADALGLETGDEVRHAPF
jgi:arginine N-succinyltransferase